MASQNGAGAEFVAVGYGVRAVVGPRLRNGYRRRRSGVRRSWITVGGVIEKVLDAVDGDGGVEEEVWLRDGGVIDGEIGGCVGGDEDGFGREKSGEAGAGG